MYLLLVFKKTKSDLNKIQDFVRKLEKIWIFNYSKKKINKQREN